MKWISWIIGVLVFVLAVGAFVLSYVPLHEFAIGNGIDEDLAWVWPLMLDGAMLVFSLSLLRAYVQGDGVKYPWFLIGLFAVLSAIFNYVHAPKTIEGRAAALIPPVALVLSFELLMSQLRQNIQRNRVTKSIQELTNYKTVVEIEIQERQTTVDQLDTDITKRQTTIEQLNNDIKQLRSEQRSVKAAHVAQNGTNSHALAELSSTARNKKIEQRRTLVRQYLDSGWTNEQMAVELGVSTKTIERDIATLAS